MAQATSNRPEVNHVVRRTSLHAIISTVAATACWVAGRPVPAFLLTLAAIAFTADWINSAYQASVRADGIAPRWLATLETFRSYLANEEPDRPEAVR